MDFTGLFEIQGMLFSIMILGLLLKKKGVIKEQSQELLTDLVVYVTLPCSIVRSFEIEFDHEILVNCLIILIVALGIQVGSYILSFILYPHMGERRKKVLQYATICSNAGILGNPIAESIFGPLGLLYASIYLIPQRIFMWSAGPKCCRITMGSARPLFAIRTPLLARRLLTKYSSAVLLPTLIMFTASA